MSPRSKSEWIGIHKHNAGWRAVVSRGSDERPVKKWFLADTPPSVMQQWRKEEKARWTLVKPRRVSGSFRADVDRYLTDPNVKRRPSYGDRVTILGRWVQVFGDRRRSEITPEDIRRVRDQWAAQPRSKGDSRTLAPGTLNIALMTLSNLWTVLDGRQHYNPVKEVKRLTIPERSPRDLSRKELAAILSQLSTRGEAVPGGFAAGSKTRARLLVMATTGLPPSTLKRLTPADVDLKRKIIYRPSRRKGHGQPPSPQPLTAEAVKAFKEFARLNCWGSFSLSGTRTAFLLAAEKAGITRPVRAYDLRHTFLTELAKASRDEVAVMEIAQHGSINTTRIYTGGSISARVKDAMAAMERRSRRR